MLFFWLFVSLLEIDCLGALHVEWLAMELELRLLYYTVWHKINKYLDNIFD